MSTQERDGLDRGGLLARTLERLYVLALVCWVGSAWTSGYVAAPILFAHAPTRALAGDLAGALFAVTGWIGIGCGAFVLAWRVRLLRSRSAAAWPAWVAGTMLVLALAGQFWLAPLLASIKQEAKAREGVEVMQSTLRSRFGAWHGVSSTVFLVESVLGLLLVATLRDGAPMRRADPARLAADRPDPPAHAPRGRTH